MKAFYKDMPIFLKSYGQRIRERRKNQAKKLQEALQELGTPQYEKVSDAAFLVCFRFCLLLMRLVCGIVLLLFSVIFLRGSLESFHSLSLGMVGGVFLFFAFVCLIPPFFVSNLQQWKELFVCSPPKRLTLKFLLQIVLFCIALSLTFNTVQVVRAFFTGALR